MHPFSVTKRISETRIIGFKVVRNGGFIEGRKENSAARKKYIIEGEQIEPYPVFGSSHDGSGAIKVAMTPIRVVCQNTLNLALNSAKRIWSTVHIGNLSAKMNKTYSTLQLSEKYMSNLGNEFSNLAKIKLTDSKTLLPIDELPTDIHRKNIQRIREDLKTRYFKAPDLEHVGKNAYRFMCAVSDFATHAKPLRATSSYREGVFAKTIDGNPLIDKAYEMALSAV
ncbi:MAG: DUF945 domain-containing protein [Lachnospiraceae bacterium]|nr:DUF945 domain-containing protein [Lachnospiraceae bacterium]